MKYEVKESDSLWKISKKFLGRGAKWKKIYSYNYEIIGDDPDLILPGQILDIPKYRLYIECLKVHHDAIEEKIKKGEMRYLNTLFKIQDDIMAESLALFIKSVIVLLFFTGLIVLKAL